jgi:hypothetical protein
MESKVCNDSKTFPNSHWSKNSAQIGSQFTQKKPANYGSQCQSISEKAREKAAHKIADVAVFTISEFICHTHLCSATFISCGCISNISA